MLRSAAGSTSTTASSVLFDGSVSGVEEVAVATSTLVPTVSCWSTIVRVTVSSSRSAPIAQSTTPGAPGAQSGLEPAGTNVAPAGSVSLTVTPAASEGPPLWTVIV